MGVLGVEEFVLVLRTTIAGTSTHLFSTPDSVAVGPSATVPFVPGASAALGQLAEVTPAKGSGRKRGASGKNN